jgi:hypothetical protein
LKGSRQAEKSFAIRLAESRQWTWSSPEEQVTFTFQGPRSTFQADVQVALAFQVSGPEPQKTFQVQGA